VWLWYVSQDGGYDLKGSSGFIERDVTKEGRPIAHPDGKTGAERATKGAHSSRPWYDSASHSRCEVLVTSVHGCSQEVST
jgi:hypothetical protein